MVTYDGSESGLEADGRSNDSYRVARNESPKDRCEMISPIDDEWMTQTDGVGCSPKYIAAKDFFGMEEFLKNNNWLLFKTVKTAETA